MTKTAPQGYYAASSETLPPFAPHAGATKTEIAVVGAGFTGLSAALHLARAGTPVTVLEAQTIGFAASGRNGGQIHSGQRVGQVSLERWLGQAHARDLWSLAEESKRLVRRLARQHAIECELRDGLVIAAHNARALRELTGETEHLQRRYGVTTMRMQDAPCLAKELGTANYPGGRIDASGGHLHPLKYTHGLARAASIAGARIHERSRVRAFEQEKDRVMLWTDNGPISASRAILACDAFIGDIAPELACYVGHVESFIVATARIAPEQATQVIPSRVAVADTRHVLDYYRMSADDRLLFAGRERYWRMPSDIVGLVRPRMLRVFPALCNTPIDYAWSGTVGITHTRMPHFGRLGERVLFGYGYSGHGVALATLGGKLLAEAALGRSEGFDVMARVPPTPFPGGPWLRKPLISAGLAWYKLMDAL